MPSGSDGILYRLDGRFASERAEVVLDASLPTDGS